MMGMEAEISHGIQTNDIISILQGHVQEGRTFNPLTELTDEQREYDQTLSLDDKVHCLDLKMIYRSKKIRDKIEECSNTLGVTKNYIFPVKNYSEEITTNTGVDILILMAVTNIVNFANDFVEREYQ
ncbi:hypothetical protein AOLI_G00237820 [Acnodon oligacanthus]